jgi:hypothetical protein
MDSGADGVAATAERGREIDGGWMNSRGGLGRAVVTP